MNLLVTISQNHMTFPLMLLKFPFSLFFLLCLLHIINMCAYDTALHICNQNPTKPSKSRSEKVPGEDWTEEEVKQQDEDQRIQATQQHAEMLM